MLKRTIPFLVITSLAIGPIVGCESLPGDEKTQGAVIGGVAGGVAGAAIAKNNRLLGGLIGAALGAGGGYLIGAQIDKANDDDDKDDAIKAERRAREHPVTAAEARRATTADVNEDGYVTMDEVVAMAEAGLSEKEMIERLEKTNQFFELTSEQEEHLIDKGVPRRVVTAMRTINADVKDRAYETIGSRDER